MKNSISATPNHSQRTFTIRKYTDGKVCAKYRTIRLDREEFQSCLSNTSNDWANFLKHGNSDYSVIL